MSNKKIIQASALYIDIVSFSKKFDEVQNRYINNLNSIVNKIFNGGEMKCKYSILPTGDGMLIVFLNECSLLPLQTAIMIHETIKEKLLNIPIRMGIHEGPVIPISDVNNNPNFIGNTMNICQRVMDVGDKNHILLSENSHMSVRNSEQYSQHLRPIKYNPIRVKHSVSISVYNYYDGTLGNPEEPKTVKNDIGIVESSIGRYDSWTELVNTQKKLKIIGNSLPIFGDPQLHDKVIALIRDFNTEIKICLLNPLSQACNIRRFAQAYKSDRELLDTIHYVTGRLIELDSAVNNRKLLQIRLFDTIPTYTGFICDNFAGVSFYIEHLSGSRGPYFRLIHETSRNYLYDLIEKSFDVIWDERSISIFDSEQMGKYVNKWNEKPTDIALDISDTIIKMVKDRKK